MQRNNIFIFLSISFLFFLPARYFRSPKTQPPKLLAEQAFAMGTVEHAEESDHLMSDQTNGGLRLTGHFNLFHTYLLLFILQI